MKKPYIIGLTGGIGCGKSTVARMLEKRGYPVIDADLLGHRVLEPSHPGFNEVLQAFGKGILDQEGRISRPKLGLMVFQDPSESVAYRLSIDPLSTYHSLWILPL